MNPPSLRKGLFSHRREFRALPADEIPSRMFDTAVRRVGRVSRPSSILIDGFFRFLDQTRRLVRACTCTFVVSAPLCSTNCAARNGRTDGRTNEWMMGSGGKKGNMGVMGARSHKTATTGTPAAVHHPCPTPHACLSPSPLSPAFLARLNLALPPPLPDFRRCP